MNNVTVKIINEQNTGIPNLLVVLYDDDANQQQWPNVADPPVAGPDVVGINVAGLYVSGFWGQLGGDRLGSGITDSAGIYKFEFEDTEFRIGDKEQRPDLLLFVMAPETTLGIQNGIPLASPPTEQIIHFSNVARVDAGRSESYIVKLTHSQLEKFGILVPGSEANLDEFDPQKAADQYLSNRKNSQSFNSLIHEKLSEEIQQKLDRRQEVRADIKQAVRNLSTLSKKDRESPFFLFGEADQDQIELAFLKAREDGVSHLEDYRKISEASDPTVRVLDAGKLRRGGIFDPPSLGDRFSITAESFCSLMHPTGGGHGLTRVKNLLEAARITVTIPEETGEPTTTESIPNGQPTDEFLDIEKEIQNRVLGQLSDLATFDTSSEEQKDPLVRLKESLNSLQLGTGPANVTAYHDFHSLQIAFKHVWTEAFDSNMKSDIEDLYDARVELHEERNLRIPPIVEMEEARDVERFLGNNELDLQSLSEPPPASVIAKWPDATATWAFLDILQQADLQTLAENRPFFLGIPVTEPLRTSVWSSDMTDAERIRAGKIILASASNIRNRVSRLNNSIMQYLTEPYAFRYFQPDSVNYGILATYRQECVPGPYQVGDLVSTIPLAPGETRKFTKESAVKRTRATKEIEKAMSTRRGESSQTRRADSEIMDKVSSNSNFNMTAQGSFSFGIGSISSTTGFALNQANESASTKKDFREAVLKASYEYSNERSLEISTTDELTATTTTSGELKNPNNELAVTYLLYELERQYRVTERIHRLTPVILVAQDVPNPNEINEGWLIRHEWILRRVLLDDSFYPALDYLTDSFAGEELSLSIKKENWETQKDWVEKLESTVETHLSHRNALRDALVMTTEERDLARSGVTSTGQDVVAALFTGGFSLFGSDPAEDQADRSEARRKVIQAQLDYLESTIQAAQAKASIAVEAFGAATQAYTDALEAATNRRVTIDQCRVHVKDNILYYMQAIWDHEPPDQRYFRLFDKLAFVPRQGSVRMTIRLASEGDRKAKLPGIEIEGESYVIETESLPIPDITEDNPDNYKPLVEVADLDNPLGYKGNYIIFPLKTCTFITDYMMREYIDDYFGIRDPDELAEFTSEELYRYAESVRSSLTRAERNELDRIITRRLTSPRRESDLIVVPSGQLYMEALLGEQALLEPFKLAHRGYDAAKARAELRERELENLRLASRLLQDQPLLDDPNVDKLVVVNGHADVHVDTP